MRYAIPVSYVPNKPIYIKMKLWWLMTALDRWVDNGLALFVQRWFEEQLEELQL